MDPHTWVRWVAGSEEPGEPLPAGRLLEELLLGACLRRDLPVLRRLLTGWMAALPDAAAGDVVVDHHRYALLHRDPREDVLADFARTLIAGSYPHPWPAATDVATLTAVLRGAAGLPSEISEIPDAEEMPDSRREHEEQVRALRRQLADAASRAEWYELELDKRNDQLRTAYLQITVFGGSLSYRVAKSAAKAARSARNRLRRGTTT